MDDAFGEALSSVTGDPWASVLTATCGPGLQVIVARVVFSFRPRPYKQWSQDPEVNSSQPQPFPSLSQSFHNLHPVRQSAEIAQGRSGAGCPCRLGDEHTTLAVSIQRDFSSEALVSPSRPQAAHGTSRVVV